MSGDTKAPQITGKELLHATAPFAEEDRPRSWRLFGSTLVILSAVLVIAAVAPWWPLRLVASIVGGLTIVRVFIFYHDFLHGALLSDSRLAQGLLYIIGLLMLTPPKHWRYSHNYHHAHVGKVIISKPDAYPVLTADIGSFPLMTTQQWAGASTWHRLRYRVTRHPLSILGAYVTIFLFVNCLLPLLKEPRKYWDGGAISVGPRRIDRAVVGVRGLGRGALRVCVALCNRRRAGSLSVLCAAHVRGPANRAAGELDLLSRRAGVFDVHAARPNHAVVYRQHRLSSRASRQFAYSVLSPAGSNGRHPRPARSGDYLTSPARYSLLLPGEFVGPRSPKNGQLPPGAARQRLNCRFRLQARGELFKCTAGSYYSTSYSHMQNRLELRILNSTALRRSRRPEHFPKLRNTRR